MNSLKPNSCPVIAEIYKQHRERGDCGDVAAALLTVADAISQLPNCLKSTLATVLAAPLSDGVGNPAIKGHVIGRVDLPVTAGPSPNAHGRLKTDVTAAHPRNAGATNGQRVPRVRGDRNRADLQVLDDFLPPEEANHLSKFLHSAGIELEGRTKMQELLTVVVYYIATIRKTTCSHNHIHTVLKRFGVKTPNDLGARLRDVNRRRGYLNANDPKDIQLTMKGEAWMKIKLASTTPS